MRGRGRRRRRRRQGASSALGLRRARRERVDERRVGGGSRRSSGRGQGSVVSTRGDIPKLCEEGLSPGGLSLAEAPQLPMPLTRPSSIALILRRGKIHTPGNVHEQTHRRRSTFAPPTRSRAHRRHHADGRQSEARRTSRPNSRGPEIARHLALHHRLPDDVAQEQAGGETTTGRSRPPRSSSRRR